MTARFPFAWSSVSGDRRSGIGCLDCRREQRLRSSSEGLRSSGGESPGGQQLRKLSLVHTRARAKASLDSTLLSPSEVDPPVKAQLAILARVPHPTCRFSVQCPCRRVARLIASCPQPGIAVRTRAPVLWRVPRFASQARSSSENDRRRWAHAVRWRASCLRWISSLSD